MKSLMILSTIALVSSSAMAVDAEMNLEGRFDYIHTETEARNGTAAPEKTSKGEYSAPYLSLEAATKFNSSTTLKLVLDLTDSNDSTKVNGITEFVDEVILTKSFGDFSVVLGKQAPAAGGFEAAEARRDIALESGYYSAIGNNLVGASASYSLMGQTLTFQHLELADTTAPVYTDKKVTGLSYLGNFMDGMIAPIFSYHKYGTNRSGKYDVYTTVALQFSARNWIAQLDYSMLKKEDGGFNSSASIADAELNSIVAHVRYGHEHFVPFVKFMKETGKGSFDGLISTNSAVETERTSYELGLQYIPNKDEDMNYHVVYNSSESEETTGTAKATSDERKLYAGVSFGVNLLK